MGLSVTEERVSGPGGAGLSGTGRQVCLVQEGRFCLTQEKQTCPVQEGQE